MLTAKELRVAAARAESYPPGYGRHWGYDSRIVFRRAGVVAGVMLRDPSCAEYG